MTLKIHLNIIQTNFHRGETFDFSLVLLMKLAPKNKMYTVIQLNWIHNTIDGRQDELINLDELRCS